MSLNKETVELIDNIIIALVKFKNDSLHEPTEESPPNRDPQTISLSDVQHSVLLFVKEKGRDAFIEYMECFGISKVTELKEHQYKIFVEGLDV